MAGQGGGVTERATRRYRRGPVGWFARTRQDWIAEMLHVYGFINREHLMRKFLIAEPSASKDIQVFLRTRPGVMAYNAHTKRYERR
jgi:hypothetical protein